MASSEKTAQPAQVYFKGSCACGRMTYDCTSLPKAVYACHCLTCRKLSGGPFQAFAGVGSKTVILYDNQEHLRYEGLPTDTIGGITFLRLSKAGERAFCVSCHTPLAMRYKHEPDQIDLALGMIDNESVKEVKVRDALKPIGHIFVSQKAWWVDVDKDGIPVHDRFPGDFEQRMKAWDGKGG